MRANESVENYDSRIREYANYSFRQSRNICKTIGERQAGSENEDKLQQHIAGEMKTCADRVSVEEFKFAPDHIVLQNKVGALSFILAAAILLFSLLTGFIPAVAGISSIIISIIGIILSFSGKCYAQKKLTSKNVYGVKKSSGKAEKRIILVGNADCMRSRKMAGASLKTLSVLSGIVFLVTGVILFLRGNNITDIISEGYVKYLSIPLCVFVIFDILVLFRKYDSVSAGANKNLSGSFTCIALLKYLKDMNITLERTEVAVLITGAHEASLSGAKAFVKEKASDLKDIPTCVLCLDCLREESDLSIKPQKGGEDLAKTVSLCSKVSGYEISLKDMKYKTDAEAFSKAGIPSCTITAVPEGVDKLEDTYEDMKIRTIETSLKAVMETVFTMDEN